MNAAFDNSVIDRKPDLVSVAPPAPLIVFEGVSKRFGDVSAVEDVSLEIGEGELFCLLGASGCGKSTLMRMLAGFEEPSAGTITLAGVDLAGLPPHRRPVNMMFQSYALFPHLNVAENVAFGLKREGLPKAEIASRVTAMLDLVQLSGLERRKPDKLSGGQRQRVALARALAKRPKVLLLDEPLGALDRKLREETQAQLVALQAELGITFVMVTHDQDEAMSMAHRIAIMDKGRLVQVGTPRAIYENPATRDIARFVGDITLIEAVIVAHDKGLALAQPEKGGAPFCVAAAEARIGSAVAIGLRPEKLALHREAPPVSRPNARAGQLLDATYLGDLTLYRVGLDEGGSVKVSQANLLRQTSEPFSPGEPVFVSFDPDAAMLIEH